MTGFARARGAFVDYAAGRLKVRAGKIKAIPADEELADDPGETWRRVGKLWRFETDDGAVRGWAGPDGALVTPEQNVGRLLEEAGVWQGTASADTIAQQLTWALGTSYKLRVGSAQLTVSGSAGQLHFVVTSQPPGSWETVSDVRVAFTGDHAAQLSRTPVPAAPAAR